MTRLLVTCAAVVLLPLVARADDKVVLREERHENNGNAEVWVWVTVTDVGERYKIEVRVKAQVNNRSGTARCAGGLLALDNEDQPKVTVLKHLTVGSRPFNNTTHKEESLLEYVRKGYYDANAVKERIVTVADYNKGIPTTPKELAEALKDHLKTIGEIGEDADKAFGSFKVFSVKSKR